MPSLGGSGEYGGDDPSGGYHDSNRDSSGDAPERPSKEESDFEWNWSLMLLGVVPGVIINGINWAVNQFNLSPYEAALLRENMTDPNDPLSEDYKAGGGAEKDGVLNSDGTFDMDGSGDSKDGGKLLSGKAIRKAGQNQLWDELQNPSDYDTAIEGMGLRSSERWNTLMTQMESGEFELPDWMQNISDKNFGRFTEASSRKGQLPGSTAYGQGTAAFNLADQESASNYGLGMLGMSYDQALGPYNSMNANRTNQYSTLFGGGSGLLDPQKQNNNEPSKWETMLQIGGDALTGYAYGKAGGMWK